MPLALASFVAASVLVFLPGATLGAVDAPPLLGVVRAKADGEKHVARTA